MNEIADIDYPSLAMQRVLAACRQAAATLITVLLLGESGTGKDFLSKRIHEQSRRSTGPFFVVNCAAIAQELVESELFGHERGAFTGATETKKGLLQQAHGGTLFLNEIGASSLSFQAKLLAFLDYQKFVRVGGEKVVDVDVRIIAATSRDLQELSRQGLFLPDLLYRLEVFPIWVPPLRERKEDIPTLVRDLMSQLAEKMKREYIPTVDLPALEKLAYDWPGNVRELRNILERSLALNYGKPVLNAKMIISAMNQSRNAARTVVHLPAERAPLEISDQEFKRMIEEVFGDSPTPVEVVGIVLRWKRKRTAATVKRVGCCPGKAGRLPKTMKMQMISAFRQCLQDNGFL